MVASMKSKKTQVTEFTLRTSWFSNAEILKQATSIIDEALGFIGPRNPYPEKLGVTYSQPVTPPLLVPRRSVLFVD